MSDINQTHVPQTDPYGQGDLSTPESMAEAVRTIYAAMLAKNRVSADEFAEFEPLFVKAEDRHQSEAYLVDLARKYAERFDAFNPVYVLSGPETDPKTKVVRKVPAIFKRIGTVNELGPDAELQASIFSNIMQRPETPVSLEHTIAKGRMTRVIAALVDDTTPRPIVEFEKALQAKINTGDAKAEPEPHNNVDALLDAME